MKDNYKDRQVIREALEGDRKHAEHLFEMLKWEKLRRGKQIKLDGLVKDYQNTKSKSAFDKICYMLKPKIDRVVENFDRDSCKSGLECLILRYKNLGKKSHFLGYFHKYYFWTVRDIYKKKTRVKKERRIAGFRNKDIENRVNEFLKTLPIKRRSIMAQYMFTSLNSKQIARRLNKKPSTIRNTKKIALNTLDIYDSSENKTFANFIRNKLWNK